MQSDHEKHTQRSKEVEEAAAQQAVHSGRGSAAGPGPQSQLNTDAARLYQSRDLSLKEGETIKINLKRPGSAGASKVHQLAQSLPRVSLLPPQQARAPMQAPVQPPAQVCSALVAFLQEIYCSRNCIITVSDAFNPSRPCSVHPGLWRLEYSLKRKSGWR